MFTRDLMLLLDTYDNDDFILLDRENTCVFLLATIESTYELWFCLNYAKTKNLLIPFLQGKMPVCDFMKSVDIIMVKRYYDNYTKFIPAPDISPNAYKFPKEGVCLKYIPSQIIDEIVKKI